MTGSASLARSAVLPSSSLSSLLAQCARSLSDDDKDATISALLPSLSVSDSLLSFEDAPPFPARKPLIFTNLTTQPILAGNHAKAHSSSSVADVRSAMMTVPSGPRVRAMLLERIRVDRWMNTLRTNAPPNHEAWNQTQPTEGREVLSPPWIPEGSLFPFDAFKAMFRNRPGQVVKQPSITLNDGYAPTSPSAQAHPVIPRSASTNTVNSMKLGMPTITVSNSTAVLPVSLSSSYSLNMHTARECDVSLAARRGRKAPPALTLVTSNSHTHSGGSDLESYPSIPSPFLGSPSSSTPMLQLSPSASAVGAVPASLDLQAMCADLRARCPPLYLSPPISPATAQPASPVSACSQFSTDSDSDSDDGRAEVASASGDEWAFAKELLEEYEQDQPPGFTADPGDFDEALVPTARPGANAEDLETAEDDFSWANTATFINSVDFSAADNPQQSTPATSKQQRRKTVIIETPVHPAKLLAPLLSPTTPDAGLDDHAPLPFESPLSNASTGDSILCVQCRHSTPPPSRPASSASLRPVRGILKGKKMVRFSVVQETHAYALHDAEHKESHSSPTDPTTKEVDSKPDPKQVSKPEFKQDKQTVKALMGPPRASAIRARSPLRQSHTPSPTSPTFSLSPPTSPPAHLPRHPALARTFHAKNTPVTPALLAEQRKAPAKSVNARQSLPARRTSQAMQTGVAIRGIAKRVSRELAERPSRVSRERGAGAGRVLMDTKVGPQRLLKTLSSPPEVRERADENAARSDARAGAAQRSSRMPVPFRAVLAKLKQ